MITQQEIRALIDAVLSRGHAVATEVDQEGAILKVCVRGMPGVGPRPMPVIEAAERIREALAINSG